MDPRKFSAQFRRKKGALLTQENFRRARFTSPNSRHFANRSTQATFFGIRKSVILTKSVISTKTRRDRLFRSDAYLRDDKEGLRGVALVGYWKLGNWGIGEVVCESDKGLAKWRVTLMCITFTFLIYEKWCYIYYLRSKSWGVSMGEELVINFGEFDFGQFSCRTVFQETIVPVFDFFWWNY